MDQKNTIVVIADGRNVLYIILIPIIIDSSVATVAVKDVDKM